MTNQKTIERLKAVRNYLCAGNPIWDVNEMRDVFELAISALEAQEELYVYSQCKTCRYYHDNDVRCMICDDENDMYEAQEAKTQLSAEGTTSDLISRQDAIDVLGVFTQADALGHTPKQIVEALPSVKPEVLACGEGVLNAQPEIIYCRNCKHFGTDKYKKLTWCGRKDYGYGWGENDFCSRAERRTDESD